MEQCNKGYILQYLMQIRTEEILLIVNYMSKNKQTNKHTLEGEGSDIGVTALRCRDFPWKVPTALGAHLWSNKDGLTKSNKN